MSRETAQLRLTTCSWNRKAPTKKTLSAKADAGSWLRSDLVASWREIIAVLTLTVGYDVYCAARLAIYEWGGHRLDLRDTNYGELHVMAQQSALLALLLLYLNWRGWTTADLKIKPGWWSMLQAPLLLMANFVVLIAGMFVIWRWRVSYPSHLAPRPYFHASVTHLSWATVIAYQFMNAFSEEVICMCYAFNQFAAKHGPLVAMGLMLLLRASYHIWKSPGFLCITVIEFSLYGAWYWRTRNVWPLILAHAGYDILLSISQIR